MLTTEPVYYIEQIRHTPSRKSETRINDGFGKDARFLESAGTDGKHALLRAQR
jgi:hypothetical protein